MNDDDLNDLDLNGEEEEIEEGSAPAQDNRPFIFAAVGIGALILIGLIILGAALWSRFQNTQEQQKIAREIQGQTQTVVAQITQEFIAEQTEEAEVIVLPTTAPTVTRTPVLAPIVTNTVAIPIQTQTYAAAQTATVSYLQTQVATQRVTQTRVATSTRLPSTGFADEVGMPGLFGLAVVLLAVIFLVRRLRTA